MRLGREATAARRQASRLAGLVRLPAGWPIQTAIRRQASWLAKKASVEMKPRWPFVLQKYPSCIEASQAMLFEMDQVSREKQPSPFCCAAKPPSYNAISQLALVESASRQLWGSRAEIGSGGKKARPF